MADGRVFKTEQAAINHVFALIQSDGCWPGYRRVPGGFQVSYEPDELAGPPPDEYPEDATDDDDSADDGTWHDTWLDEDEAA